MPRKQMRNLHHAGYHNEPVREVEAVLPGPLIRYLDLRPTNAEELEVGLQLKKWKTDLEALPCPIDKAAWLAAIRVQEPQLGFPAFLAAEVMIEAMEDRHRVLAASSAVKPATPCEVKKPATTSAPTRSKRCTDMPSKIPWKKFTWCLPGASKMKDTAKIPEQSVPDQGTASCLDVSTMSFQALIEKPSDERIDRTEDAVKPGVDRPDETDEWVSFVALEDADQGRYFAFEEDAIVASCEADL